MESGLGYSDKKLPQIGNCWNLVMGGGLFYCSTFVHIFSLLQKLQALSSAKEENKRVIERSEYREA